MRRSSRRSPVMEMQIRPRPNFAMKLIESAVTYSAAWIRSPSFSRSSSSTTIRKRPARISVMPSSMVARPLRRPLERPLSAMLLVLSGLDPGGCPCHELLHVLRQDIRFQVYSIADLSNAKIGVRARERDDRDHKAGIVA